MGRKRGRGRLAASLASIAVLAIFWHLGSLAVGQALILPSPLRVLGEFAGLLGSADFLSALGATFGRGLSAFGLSLALGGLAGFASGTSPLFAAALAPLLTTIRATPVLALILLTLLWFPAGFVPVFAAFLMSFPVMTQAAAAGARVASPELLEMASLFKVPARRVFLGLRLPAALPHMLSGARSTLGLSWKVVVAGEVLSQPLHAIGSGMQASRVLLETPRVFAWALSAILLCGLTEWIFARLIGEAGNHGA